jgi:hypothetical protein
VRRSPVTDAWDPLFSRETDGVVYIGLRVAERHCNSRAFLHGGVIAAVADNAMGLSFAMTLRARNHATTAAVVTLSLASRRTARSKSLRGWTVHRFHSTVRLTGRWFRGRLTVADLRRGIPFVHSKVREATQRKKTEKLKVGVETAYCAETVPSITYEQMGLLTTEKHYNWFDRGSFWSGDSLPLAAGYQLGDEIAVAVD